MGSTSHTLPESRRTQKRLCRAVLCCLAVTVGFAITPAPAAGAAECPSFTSGETVGHVADGSLDEISGIVASRRNPGVLWVHNDSGDSARVYAIRMDGTLLGKFTLAGAGARDWEDIALGPGPAPGTDYLYLGDIGDNAQQRSSVSVYRVAEPRVDPTTYLGSVTLDAVDELKFAYADGPHNAETLLADPVSGDLFVLTKASDGNSRLFRYPAPQDPATLVILDEVARVRFGSGPLAGSPFTTGGDISPRGDELLIRTYSAAFMWSRGEGVSIADALTGPVCVVPARSEPQGEAIGFGPREGDYFTVSEHSFQPLYRYSRVDFIPLPWYEVGPVVVEPGTDQTVGATAPLPDETPGESRSQASASAVREAPPAGTPATAIAGFACSFGMRYGRWSPR